MYCSDLVAVGNAPIAVLLISLYRPIICSALLGGCNINLVNNNLCKADKANCREDNNNSGVLFHDRVLCAKPAKVQASVEWGFDPQLMLHWSGLNKLN